MAKSKYVAWFSEVDKNDVDIVGGKGANLGEMIQNKFPVPDGFIVTANSYFEFIKHNNFTTKIKHLINTINYENQASLMQVSGHIKKLINEGEIPEQIRIDIINAYKKMDPMLNALVAVRSSATAEDLPEASFAGQQETYLNVSGEANLLNKVRAAWASLFEARAIYYRQENKFNHFKVGLAAVVQKMINSEMSGVMFTVDPVTNSKERVIIEGIYGLGEMIVQGKVTPDHYEVSKSDMKIVSKTVQSQDIQMIKKDGDNKIIKVESSLQNKQKITNDQIVRLANLGKRLEKHYYFPQDSEWAIEDDHVYIVQTRPITTFKEDKAKSTTQDTKINLEKIAMGSPASPGIASGAVKIIKNLSDLDTINPGDIMVAEQTNPDYVPGMKKSGGIITEKGGRTSHAAIVSRELGIPAVVGAIDIFKVAKQNDLVTLNGKTGEIYKGEIKITAAAEIEVENIKTATKIYVNLAQPDIAEKVSKFNPDGIGLLRAEFMMANIGTHPKKMIRDGKRKEFIEKLATQLEMFCKPFSPRPVVYRTSDFKTNEYRGLVGGKEFEPHEENPMIGYRGAFRYLHDQEVFDMELEAIKIVRNKMGYKNLWVMIPFIRTVKQLMDVKRIMSEAGLHRSNSFKIWMMVEVPTNFILLEDYIKVGIDGVSIGSNDLTMLILGTDRDNSEIASIYDERDKAVEWALERIITTCKKHNITCSICGQAPSLYPDLVEQMVSWGITSVSVSPDVINETRRIVAGAEKKVLGK